MSQQSDSNRTQSGGKNGSSMSAALHIRDDLAHMLPRVLRRTQEPAKVLAFKAGVSKRTVEGVRRGESEISAPALLALAREYPAVKALVLSLVDAETGDSGQNPAQILSQIATLVARANK
jgi:hypothetical protein